MSDKKSSIPAKFGSIKKCMNFALENIIKYGDTDIFPYPVERQIFRDKKEETVDLLTKINKSFDEVIGQMPAEYEKLL